MNATMYVCENFGLRFFGERSVAIAGALAIGASVGSSIGDGWMGDTPGTMLSAALVEAQRASGAPAAHSSSVLSASGRPLVGAVGATLAAEFASDAPLVLVPLLGVLPVLGTPMELGITVEPAEFG
jgi:hypothetical protein